MRKIITAALIAATAIPVAAMPEIASAQSRREVRESYRDLKEERRDLRRAYRYGDRRDIKREHRRESYDPVGEVRARHADPQHTVAVVDEVPREPKC